MANHCINPCDNCGQDLGDSSPHDGLCFLCWAEQFTGTQPPPPDDYQQAYDDWRNNAPLTDEERDQLFRDHAKYAP